MSQNFRRNSSLWDREIKSWKYIYGNHDLCHGDKVQMLACAQGSMPIKNSNLIKLMFLLFQQEHISMIHQSVAAGAQAIYSRHITVNKSWLVLLQGKSHSCSTMPKLQQHYFFWQLSQPGSPTPYSWTYLPVVGKENTDVDKTQVWNRK